MWILKNKIIRRWGICILPHIPSETISILIHIVSKTFNIKSSPREKYTRYVKLAKLVLRASPAVLSMWSCRVQLEEESQNVSIWLRKMVLAQHNCTVWWRAQRHCPPAEKSVINMIWLLLSVFLSAHSNDWSRWFAISSPPPICCPSFSFMGGVAKK